MPTQSRQAPRREESLSRDQIVDAAIALLDGAGEAGLTFRALSDRLATGPGAIYGHIAHKNDLLVAACDALVARTLAACPPGATPRAAIRSIALAMFDALDAHPWLGSALMQSAGQPPMLRMLERLGQPLQALGVARKAHWPAVSALLHYIVGVGGLNAANTQVAQARGLDRDDFMGRLAQAWSQLDADDYPFVRSMAAELRAHDDRADFAAGVDLLLQGLEAPRRR